MKRSDFVAKVNEQYGAGTLSPLADAPEIGRIPTGILDLDVSMGGGFPVGRMSMVWGPRSSGKSTLCFKAIAYAQTLCRYDGLPLGDPSLPYTSNLPLEAIYTNAKGEVVTDPFTEEEDDDGNITEALKKGVSETPHQEPMYTLLANTESALDPHWCRNNGIDPDLIYPLDTAVAEQTIDVISNALHSEAWDLIVLDSIAQMTPSVEIEESTEKWQQGQLARLMNKAFRIWTAALASHTGHGMKPSIILVNQERDKIGGWSPSGAPPAIKPGGKGQDFVTSMEIKLKAITKDDNDNLSSAADKYRQVAKTGYRITKNKTAPAGATGSYGIAVAPFDQYRPGDVIQMKAVMKAARDVGMVKKGDKGKWEIEGIKKSFKTLVEIHDYFNSQPDDYARVQRDVVRTLVDSRR